MEAEVAIRFYVDAEGFMMPGNAHRTHFRLRPPRPTLHGQSFKIGLLRPRAPGSGAQWGVITFRFILE